jgi:predicted transcriptional regulator
VSLSAVDEMSNSAPTVDDYMVRDLITFVPDDDIHEVVKILLAARISGAPVVDYKGELVGVVSKKDCFEVLYNTSYHQDWGGRVEDYMSKEVTTIESDIFMNSTFRRFPILKNGRIVGQISRADLLRALVEHWANVAPNSR